MRVYDLTGVQRSAMAALEQEIEVEPIVRELVKVRASIVNGCAYCIDLHSKRAREAASPSSASICSLPGGTRSQRA